MTGSNCRHSRCKRDALPAELIARKVCYISILSKVKCNLLKKNPTIQKNVRSDFKIISQLSGTYIPPPALLTASFKPLPAVNLGLVD